MFFKYVVVGGGVAGVSCAERLAEVTEEKVALITPHERVKAATKRSR